MTLLLLILLLLLVGGFPAWPYSRNWGFWPSGILGLLVFLVILELLGVIHLRGL